VAIRVPVGEREQAIGSLLDLARSGFEEREHGDEVELAVYTDVAGERQLRAAFGCVESSSLAPGWEDAWRAFHRPVTVGGLWVGPPWLKPVSDADTVVIDPGRAFGTGAHPTTMLCIELLTEAPRGSLLDVGCGSGVLSIAAARLGFAPIVALDVDEVAVEVTRANAEANGVALDAYALDATIEPLPPSDVAVANVSADVVTRVLPRLRCRTVITSGYVVDAVPAPDGWTRVARSTAEGWTADHYERESSV
jgi:ribosomal protein L11 methyltransferase